MEKMSKGDEDRIIQALDKVAGLVNDGEDPNVAITKIASQIKLPVGHIGLMVNAYNTGRTNIQRKSHDDVLEKAGEFPLASTATIVANMFPDTKKTAAQKSREVVSSEYNSPPSWLDKKPIEKAAAFKQAIKMCESPPEYPRDTKMMAKKAYDQAVGYQRRLETFRSQVSAFRDQINKTVDSLADYFKTAGSISVKQSQDNLKILHGDKIDAVFELINKRLPRHWTKTSFVNTSNRQDVGEFEPYISIRKVSADLVELNTLSEKLAQAETAVRQTGRKLTRPFAVNQGL